MVAISLAPTTPTTVFSAHVDLDSLNKAVRITSITLGKTEKDPVVRNFWLSVGDGFLDVVATDKSVIAFHRVQLSGQVGTGEALVPGEKFQKAISELDSGDAVMLEFNPDSQSLVIKSSRTTIALPLEPVTDFPKNIFLAPSAENLGEIYLTELMNGLKFVKAFSGGTQPHGMIIQLKNNKLVAGSVSIAVFESTNLGNIEFKIFTNNAGSLIKYLSEIGVERLVVRKQESYCYFEPIVEGAPSNSYFGFHLEELEFPSLDKMLEGYSAFCSIKVDRVFAEKVFRRISIPLYPDGSKLDIKVSKPEADASSVMQVSSVDSKGRISSEAMTARREDKGSTEEVIAVNYERMLDAINQFQAPVLDMKASAQNKMMLLEGRTETYRAIAIVPLLMA